MNKTTCPDCGETVLSSGLAAHRRGLRCTAYARKREARDRGLRLLEAEALETYKALARRGVQIEIIGSNYRPGSIRTPSRTSDQAWTTPVLKQLLDATQRMDLDRRAAVCRSVQDDQEKIEALLAALALGGRLESLVQAPRSIARMR